MTLESSLPGWLQGKERPEGLDLDGLYTKGHLVRVDGGPPEYVGPGPVIAILEAAGHEVEVADFERRQRPHAGRGSRD